MAGFLSAFGNTPAKNTQISRFNPQIQGSLNQLTQQAFQNQQQQKPFDFAPIEQRARTNFASQTVPSIANRFLAGNTRNSSGFQEALGSGAADLEVGLEQLRNQYGQQGFGNLMQLLQLGQQENIYEPEQPGFAQQTGGALLQILPLLFGGGDAGFAGSAIGQLLKYLGGAKE
jgi:hypothetical protein